jgi:TusA-related sulfurtransferase
MENKKLDLRGQMCPSSLLAALRELNTNKAALKSGALSLTLLTDNRDSTLTIPESVVRMGYEAHVIKEDGYYRIEICVSNC